MIEKEMNNIMIAILTFKEKCKQENIGEDNMETILLDVILSVGIEFSR